MRLLLAAVLRALGVEVVSADGVAAARKALAAADFDAILTDMNMPSENGIDLIRHVRSGGRHAATPIIVISSEIDGPLKRDALMLGASGWLPKPVDPGRLGRALIDLDVLASDFAKDHEPSIPVCRAAPPPSPAHPARLSL